MRTINQLQLFIQYDISPENLQSEQHLKELQVQWNSFWQLEHPDNMPSNEDDYHDKILLLDRVVRLNDQVQVYLQRQKRLWMHLKFAPMIERFYREVIDRLKKLVLSNLSSGPSLADEVALTNEERSVTVQQLLVQFHDLEKVLYDAEIEADLIGLVTKTLFVSIRRPVIKRRAATYISELITHLINSSGLNKVTLKLILYQYNFNLPEFFMYWINGWEKMLTEEPGLHEQLEIIVREQDHLRQFDFLRHRRFITSEASLKEALMGYLNEKKVTIKELIKLRRAKIKDGQLTKLITRIRTTLPVAQLALFIRLQIEKGVLAKEHVGRIFGFYAAHFYNAQTEHISPESLQKKSTDIEYATAQKFKAQLISMVNWINEHFKLDS